MVDKEKKIDQLKTTIADMIQRAGSGHWASSISSLEIMYPLFYEQGVTSDTFILSKGHAAPALYAILNDLGYLTDYHLQKFRKRIPGHPSLDMPGVLCSSGSLGMGISKAIGLAHANQEKTYHVLVGDGELQEGQNWEAILYLSRNDVKNVIVHVDRNKMQYSGPNEDRRMIIVAVPNIVVHLTTWDRDNSYLCKPKDKDGTYPKALIDAMNQDERIIALDADLIYEFGLDTVEAFHPDRVIECGISEQHMVSMANGLALAGKIPICHTFSAFYRRCLDQMYNNRCDGLHIGYVAGLTDRTGKVNIGASHAPTDPVIFETIGIKKAANIEEFFRALPNWKGVYLEVE